jgi:P27 family predicted phage terminase small subunit
MNRKGKLMADCPETAGLDEPDWDALFSDPAVAASARADWNEVVAELRSQNKLADVNGHAVSRYVMARAIYEDAARRVAKDGSVVEAPKTKVLMQHPALSIMNKQAELCAQLEAQLTLSPQKRATGGKVAAKRAAAAGAGVKL